MLLSSSTAPRVCCARCVPAASTEITGWPRSCTSAGQRIDERLLPLKAEPRELERGRGHPRLPHRFGFRTS